MAYRMIKTETDPILRKRSRVVTDFDDRLARLLDDMRDTMYKADGVGLAAVQVGILKRAIVLDCSEDKSAYVELVNPEIISTDGEQKEAEGCLSIPGKSGITCRPMRVTVRAQDRRGETFEITGEGLLARCLCHETDHLDGVLFRDRLADGETLHQAD